MRRVVALTLLVAGIAAFLLTASSAAEELAPSPPPTVQAGGPSPRIVFDATEHDFGSLTAGQVVKHTFRFRNEGDATLIIGEVKSTCGCTGTLLSKNEIPPGEYGDIEVTFTSGNSSGQKKKAIYVPSNDPQQPKVEIYIIAKVVVPVELRPMSLYWLSEKGQPSARIVELLHEPDVKLSVTKLELASPAFKASVQPKKSADTRGYDIVIKYDGTLPVGEHKETLTILTDNPNYSKLDVQIRCRVLGAVKTVPDVVALGVIKDGALPPVRTVRVYSTGQKSFEITEVKSSNPLLKVEFSKETIPNSYQVKVSLVAKPPVGAFSEKLLIQTNDPEQRSLQIPVYAHVR
ncbi:MAG: DUF1573 domain-containing protein [Candidatus Lindowbacteria bacterium]|nr:DUF1573 domain-containing protein [Candidatus Lindowbacteria bacterium]